MEDLSGQMKSIKDQFTTEQLLSIIRQLISFHAFQLNSSTKPWAGKFTKCAIEDFELYYYLPKLLCYGDLGPGNILWKNESEDRIPEFGAFIDFQQAFEGNPLFDIATLLNNVDNQTRKELETKIFQEYLLTLKCFLNSNSQKSITSLEIEKAYKYALVHEAILHVAYKAWSLETIDEMWINNSKTMLEEAINFLETCGKNWFEK
uniref:CHK kinase-like domain-containing protein n=1 Tax=Acrobeloides nanus TaxID=290746 RepID=A0A914ECC5_9BILA